MSHYPFHYLGVEFLAFITGTYFLRQIRGRFLFLYIFISIGFFTEAIQALLIFSGSRNTLWLTHIYFPLEFLFLSLLYLKNIKNIVIKKWMTVTIVVVMLFSIVNPLFLQKLTIYSQVRSFTSICLVVFSLLYFHSVMTESKIIKLSSEPMVWVNIAMLVYFAASLFHVVLFTLILEYSHKYVSLTSYYFGFLSILFYLLNAVVFVLEGRQQKKRKHKLEIT